MIGMICRMDKSGLGIQTHRLARLMKPDKIMLIDSTPFNHNEQHPEWYKEYNTTTIHGFPSESQIIGFFEGINTVISCEMFYNNHFTLLAKRHGIRTILIANPEFFDWFRPQWSFIDKPTKVIVPSHWMLDEMSQRFGAEYLPTPIFDDEFKEAREINLARPSYKTRWSKLDTPIPKRKYLFMNGKTAAEDRNGLEALYEALHHAKGDFTVTVKAQNDVKKHPDPRLIYDFSNPEDQKELYKGFDLLIQPRRYGGQTLSMCEALYCGIPVVMTDVDPNDKVLPKKWLVPCTKQGELMTRIPLDLYAADPVALAHTLDTIDLGKEAKQEAYELGLLYDADYLKADYERILQ